MIPPFVEVGSKVYAVEGWEPDMPDREQYVIWRLPDDEVRRYWQLKREADIELWANFKSGE